MNRDQISILQLCKKFPFPLVDGETIAVNSLSRGLVENDCEITLLAMNTSKQHVEIDKTAAGLQHYKEIYDINIDNKVRPLAAFKNLFSDDSYHVSRFVSSDYKQTLIDILAKQSFDYILMESMYLAPYVDAIRNHSQAKLILRSHNVEYKIWERIVFETRDPIKRRYLNYLSKKLKKYEVSILNDFDLIAAVSAKDIEVFEREGMRSRAFHNPIGLDMRLYSESNRIEFKKPLQVGFIGSLDWQPNVNGINWFIEQVWPLIESSGMEVELAVAGRNPSRQMFELADRGIQVYGEVESAIDFMSDQDLLIVPLFSGSGIRVKILEAMALSKIVITTSIGLEGINATHGHEILIADTPEDFVKCVRSVYDKSFDRVKMMSAARDFVESKFSFEELAKQLKNEMLKLN